MTETKPVCPKCGADLVVAISNQRHCNACSLDFDISKNPVRLVERFATSGYRPHEYTRKS
jgi:tRNA(Ile2) C34 agmatinyltransferase TiaS